MSILNPAGSNEVVDQISRIGDVRSDPFRIGSPKDIMPDVATLATLPIKLSLYSNAARSAFYGLNSILRIDNRYTDKVMRYSYRASTVNGLIGDIVYSAQVAATRLYRGEALAFGKTTAIARKTADIYKSAGGGKFWKGLGGVLGNWRSALRAPSSTLSEVTPWKHIYTKVGEDAYAIAEGSWKYGALDKFFVGPSHVKRALSRLVDIPGGIDKATYEALTATPKLAEDITRHYAKLTQLGEKRREYPYFEQARKVYGKATPDFSKRTLREQYDKFYSDASRGRVSIVDIIRGTGPGGKKAGGFFSAERWKARMGYFTGENAVRLTGTDMAGTRQLTLYHPFRWFPSGKARSGRELVLAQEATRRAAEDNLLTRVTDPNLDRFVNEIAGSVESRTRMARRLRAPAIALFLVPQVLKAVVGGLRRSEEFITRAGSTIKGMFRSEFGDEATVLSNSRMATERQRAVAAIQNAHMNARYIMGSEAEMYH